MKLPTQRVLMIFYFNKEKCYCPETTVSYTCCLPEEHIYRLTVGTRATQEVIIEFTNAMLLLGMDLCCSY